MWTQDAIGVGARITAERLCVPPVLAREDIECLRGHNPRLRKPQTEEVVEFQVIGDVLNKLDRQWSEKVSHDVGEDALIAVEIAKWFL